MGAAYYPSTGWCHLYSVCPETESYVGAVAIRRKVSFEDVGRANDPQRNMAHVFHSAQGACKLALGPYVTGIYIEVHGSGVDS